jgi:hypothetical protein
MIPSAPGFPHKLREVRGWPRLRIAQTAPFSLSHSNQASNMDWDRLKYGRLWI